jgi:hypothetical protein
MFVLSAIVNLNSPTHLVFQVSWVLVTLANFIVFMLLLAVFLLGGFVRLPGARKQIAAVEREQLESEEPES